MALDGSRMARRKKKPVPPAPTQQQPPPDWQWWILAAGVPLVLCASKLDLNLWSDEVYTLVFFVSKPVAEIAADYSAPNNHVLYSLLLRPFFLISESEFMLRLPSLIFTAGALAMVFRLARRWGGPSAAVLATLTLGLTQMFLVHTMQIRGYALSMFLAAWLGDLALAREATWRRLGAIVLVGAAFLYVLPTNVLFLVPLGLTAVAWDAIRKRGGRSVAATGAAWMLGGVLAALLYLPIVDEVLSARGEPAGHPLLAAAQLAQHVFSAALRDWLPILPLAAAGAALWVRRMARAPSPDRFALPLVVTAMLLGPFLLTALLGVQPFARNYCPVLPFLAVAIGWAMAELVTVVDRLFRAKQDHTAATLVGMFVLAAVAGPRLWTYEARLTEYRRSHFAQDGYYNYYAANFHPAEVVAALQAATADGRSYLVCFADADHFTLGYYFRRTALPLERRVEGSPPVIYTITPELADYDALAAKCGVPADVLRRFPLVQDFGYYRLHRSPDVAALGAFAGERSRKQTR